MLFTCELLSRRYNIIFNTCLLVLTIILFTMLIKDSLIIQEIGPSLIFVSVILVLQSAAYHPLQQEYTNGTIEQILLQPIPLIPFIIKRVIYNTLFYQIGILLIIPIIYIMTNIDHDVFYRLTISLLCSIPIIIAISFTCSALSLKRDYSGIITSIISLPLLVPISILANSVVYVTNGYKELLCLFVVILLTLPVNIMGIYYSLKIAVENE